MRAHFSNFFEGACDGPSRRPETVQLVSEARAVEIPVIDLGEVSANPCEGGQELASKKDTVPPEVASGQVGEGSQEDGKRAYRRKQRASLQRERRLKGQRNERWANLEAEIWSRTEWP